MEAYRYANTDADIVLVQMVDEHSLSSIEKEMEMIRSMTAAEFGLIAVKVDNWNNDLSPWEAPAAFGNEAFAGKADKSLDFLLGLCTDPGRTYYIGGYSLAALFALWSSYRTDIFSGVAAASPSVWFPGFSDYMRENRPKCDTIYLSLGDGEEKTKNRMMSAVGESIRIGHELLKEQGINCLLEWNSGNHFKEPLLRTAKAFAWVLNQK
ncbi:MAG: esterase [Lachnospiraceae bacterium]|nr:esterase [Lachnospiraceae bacterium]